MHSFIKVLVVAVVAIVIGVFLFFYGPDSLSFVPARIPTPPPPPPVATATTVSFKEIARGMHSTAATRVNYVITSTTDLTKLWKMIDATSTTPKVDFTTSRVFAVFAGQEPTSGYGIAVSKVEDAKMRTVTVKITKPGSNCLLAQVLTAPYQVIELSKTTLALMHKDVAATMTCAK